MTIPSSITRPTSARTAMLRMTCSAGSLTLRWLLCAWSLLLLTLTAVCDTNTAYFSRTNLVVNGQTNVAYPFKKDQPAQFDQRGRMLPPVPANARTNDLYLHNVSRATNSVNAK